MSAADQASPQVHAVRSDMKRKIAAILAADAAEYSRLVAENEEEALRQLVASVEIFRASIEAHGGRVFNTAGDAVLAEFQSAVEAVRAALDIQGKLAARNEAYPPERRMLFRMGISIGDVVENGGDLLGDGVNIAARLQTISQPGGLAISRWVQEQVAGKVPAEFRDAGHQGVKNMPAPIHVFQVVLPARSAAAVPRQAASAAPRRAPVYAALAALAAALMAAVLLAMNWGDRPGEVAAEKTPPAAESPAALPTAPRQAPETAPSIPEAPASNAPAATEKAAPPPAVAPAPIAVSPQPETGLAAAPPAGAPAAEPAVAPSAPSAGITPSAADSQPLSPATPPAVAQETPAEPKPVRKQCAEVLERAQLGDLTADDREFLRGNCR